MASNDFSSIILELEKESEKESRIVLNRKQKENTYFLLDLKLPKIRDMPNVSREFIQLHYSNTPPKKYGFLEMLEANFGMDLRSKNPWFNQTIAKERYKKALKQCKLVRFSKDEPIIHYIGTCVDKELL